MGTVEPSHPAYAAASSTSTSTATGVNYFKAGEDPPLKDDSEYPEWLWSIADPPPSLFTLERKYPEDETVKDENFTDVRLLLLVAAVNTPLRDRRCSHWHASLPAIGCLGRTQHP